METIGILLLILLESKLKTLCFISLAALLEKVRAKIFSGKTLRESIKYAILYVKTRVLPLPAPAIILSGPSLYKTAFFCSWFNILISNLAILVPHNIKK